jgi:fido (protein-threonine AMPylation protein)
LNDASVLYNPFENIAETLEYDFSEEKKFDYISSSTDDAIKHIALFIAGVWQIHPFGEGNTRTTAVFLIKYLRSFDFHIDNELFASHSWYFRNALVRANYYNREKGINPDPSFLIAFLRNLILGEQNELRNRYLHVDSPKANLSQSAESENSQSKSCTLTCTLEELAVLKFLSGHPKATQKQVF